MGMCNLTWPGADKMLAEESVSSNIPMCVSMASSTSLEKMYKFSKGNVWLQLYNFQDEEFVISHCDNIQSYWFFRTYQITSLCRFSGGIGFSKKN